MVDPTTEDNWLQDNFRSRPYVEEGDTFEDFTPAYRYGALAESRYGDAGIDLMDPQLQSDWEASKESDMPWTKAKGAVQDAYTLAEYFGSRGHATAGFVANLIYCSYDTGLDRGFTHYEDYALERLMALRTAGLFDQAVTELSAPSGLVDAGPFRSLRAAIGRSFFPREQRKDAGRAIMLGLTLQVPWRNRLHS